MYYVFASIFSYLHKQRPNFARQQERRYMKMKLFSYH